MKFGKIDSQTEQESLTQNLSPQQAHLVEWDTLDKMHL
jgi:hypothetical protein